MKKFIKSILGASMILFVGLSLCYGAPFWTDQQKNDFPFEKKENTKCAEGTADLGQCFSATESDDTIMKRLLSVFNIDIIKSDEHKFLNYVKAILNIALGLLSMIALVMTIYTFYLMFFTDNEAGAKKAKGNLVGIFIALAIIGLSWLIVSFIFRWYRENWKENSQIGEGITMVTDTLSDQIYLNV